MKTIKTILRNQIAGMRKASKISFYTLLLTFLMAINVAWAAPTNSVDKGTIVIKIAKMKSQKGNLLINLYNSEVGFPNIPEKALLQLNIKAKNATALAVFKSVKPGTYAVAICHDENSNNVCDANLLGIPKEGIGVSNDSKGFMGPPKFADSKFRLNAGRKEIEIKMSY